LVYDSRGWTGERVIEWLVPALKAAMFPNAVLAIERDETLNGPADGLRLYRIGQELALEST
jgi:hypothetical protein